MSATGNDTIATETGGLDRRTLIKRAAAAGALAWTAPVVIDSLASPASALTVACGCYEAVLNAVCPEDFDSNQDCAPAPPAGVCTSIYPANKTNNDFVPSDFGLTLTTNAGCNFRLGQVATVTIGANCTIIAAEGKVVGRGGCEVSAIAPGGKSVTFNKGNITDLWKSFSLIIKCC